jgi:hypothetical protein
VRRKPGRAPNSTKAVLLSLFPEWSPRTHERYWIAFKRLQLLGQMQGTEGTDDSPHAKAHKACARVNGSLNIAKLSQMAESMCAMYLARK